MKANETNLQPLLEGTKQYVIPLFQRVYCWTKKHWSEFWRDLLDIYEADNTREHFMGAIVTMPVEMLPQGVSKYLLIDGQQRLTTVLIILAIIRDLTDGKSDLSDQINELYLINKWGKGTNRTKLLPTVADRDTFLDVIEGNELSDGSIGQAYRYFWRMVSGRDSKGIPIDPQRMHDTLMHQLAFVSVVLSADDSPYRIFHSLNGTGVPLTQADLVRNHFLMLIPDPDEQLIAYEDFWLPMQKTLGNDLTNFMWRYVTKDGTLVRQNGIYDAMRSRTSQADAKAVVDILVEMHTYANYYVRLINPDQEPNAEIRRRLKRINRWEINTAYPFLLNIYHDLEFGRISADEMCEILDLIEAFVVRRFFCRIPTNALNNYFVAMYRSLDTSDLVASVREYLLARRFPTNMEFFAGWIRFPIYTSGTAKTRHILESLEAALNTNNELVDMKADRITIEHVMPQVLNESWNLGLGSDADNIHAVYLHSIGNLTLTGMNEAMGNIPFSDKRAYFEKSGFELNRHIGECNRWTEEEIRGRAEWLGAVAIKIWSRPAGEDLMARDMDDPTGRKPIGFVLFGNNYSASTWRELLLSACAVIAEQNGTAFADRATRVTGSRRQYINFTSEGMINPAQIPGTDLWIETNQSARSVLSMLSHILTACGYNEDEFNAVWD